MKREERTAMVVFPLGEEKISLAGVKEAVSTGILSQEETEYVKALVQQQHGQVFRRGKWVEEKALDS